MLKINMLYIKVGLHWYEAMETTQNSDSVCQEISFPSENCFSKNRFFECHLSEIDILND